MNSKSGFPSVAQTANTGQYGSIHANACLQYGSIRANTRQCGPMRVRQSSPEAQET